MRLKLFLLPILVLVMAGCASTPATKYPVAGVIPLPDECLVVQRALFNAIGRQFPLNGYLAVSATRGKRLVVTESFGSVMADLFIQPDGTVHVLQSSRMFPAHYIRRLMATDVQCVFGGRPSTDCPFVDVLSTNHFVIKRTGYKMDVRILEIKPGAQPDAMFQVPAPQKTK